MIIRVATARAVTVLITVALAVGVTACGTVDSPLPAQARPLAPATPTPPRPAALTPAALTPAAAAVTPTPTCDDPQASWRPPGRLPSPGAMPTGTVLETIERRGYLIAGVLADVPPFGSISPFTGQFEGFDVEIANLVGRRIFGADGHVRFRAVTYAERIPVLRDGAVDVVVATMTTNCERRALVDFSAVYYNETQRVLVPRDSPYQGMDDLGGRRVCTAAGAAAGAAATIRRAPSRPVLRTVPNIADCLVLLQAGEVDAVMTTTAILNGMAAQDPRLYVVGPALSDEPDAVAVSLDHPELTRFVNGVLARAIADGTWKRLARRWLSAPFAPPPTPPVARYRD
ncbi:amino acid ABC transporter substrate-binding protein, PAAT family [Frankia casuarinae]|nr:amino acid ABC transporter substrate-binding protein, PAAT family [Frankia sp. CcI6]EYT93146.1 amino acid ABC transporter substrate-binding protein, PAAT family [Frankia casuarinae]KDA42737.1 amino acid ABC transporter substrate-binding protein, PAAT family [Frankia sp. BMG5.23]KFB04171.1 amino acid ABC transporter substrate-binding protein, PAAT family [Frankia sp. Allo2]TFE32896.1 glutamate ABC transporter substrate-binding protein [Frankia sp. B2]